MSQESDAGGIVALFQDIHSKAHVGPWRGLIAGARAIAL